MLLRSEDWIRTVQERSIGASFDWLLEMKNSKRIGHQVIYDFDVEMPLESMAQLPAKYTMKMISYHTLSQNDLSLGNFAHDPFSFSNRITHVTHACTCGEYRLVSNASNTRRVLALISPFAGKNDMGVRRGSLMFYIFCCNCSSTLESRAFKIAARTRNRSQMLG